MIYVNFNCGHIRPIGKGSEDKGYLYWTVDIMSFFLDLNPENPDHTVSLYLQWCLLTSPASWEQGRRQHVRRQDHRQEGPEGQGGLTREWDQGTQEVGQTLCIDLLYYGSCPCGDLNSRPSDLLAKLFTTTL